MNPAAIGVAAVAALLTTTLPAHAQSEKDVQEVIQEFEKGDPGMKGWFENAHGYAVFHSVGKGAVDWKKTFVAAKAGGIKNYFVELNMDMLQPSYQYLHDLKV